MDIISMFDKSYQGDVFVLLTKEPYETLNFSLKKDGNTLREGKGFNYKIDSNNEIGMILIGTNAYYSTGKYEVFVEGKKSNSSNLDKGEIELSLQSKKFVEEVLHFDKKSTSAVRTEPSKRKAQSEILTKIILTFNENSNYTSGTFVQPLDYIYYTSTYGSARVNNYSDGSQTKSIHNAIDYRGKTGTPIFAPSEGKVVFAGDRITSGKTVVLEHLPGVYSMFYHMSKIDAKLGSTVKARDKLGEIGSTGLSTGSHLHWEVRVNITQPNPLFFIENNILDKERLLKLIKNK